MQFQNIMVYHNVSQDEKGRSVGMLDGFEINHSLTLVSVISSLEAPSVIDALERVYFLLNVGDDPEYGNPDPVSLLYRARGNRSLSVGDVIQIDSLWYAVGRYGWKEINPPYFLTKRDLPGTHSLY